MLTATQNLQIAAARRLPLRPAEMPWSHYRTEQSPHSAIDRHLEELRQQTQTPGWDGYGAEPVSEDAYRLARRFAELLPAGDTPALGAEPDGHITFEWYRDPEHLLSVSLSPDGMLYYAALLGRSRRSGTEPFSDTIPSEIVQLARRIQAA